MPLAVDTTRALRTEGELIALVEAVRDASPGETETDSVEWKSAWDLNSAKYRFETARHVLGFGNRSVAAAARTFAGCAYLLMGVEPGNLVGAVRLDPAEITDKLSKYIAAGQPRWTPTYVTIHRQPILVVTVEAPCDGDPICTLQQSFDEARAQQGRIYLRRHGKTEEANPAEVRALEGRVRSHRPREAITPDDIETYRDGLDAEGRLSNRVVVRHLTVLHGVFRRAMRVWDLPRNPASAELVERPPVRYSGEFTTLTPEEVRLLAAHAVDDQDRALFITAAFTGLRLGELLGLRWRDLDFELQRVHVRRNYTAGEEKAPKSGRVRSAPMVDEVMAALDRISRRGYLGGPDDVIFYGTDGGHAAHWGIRRRFYDALSTAGLPQIRFHDLRHCFATLAVQHWELPRVQGYLGHAHISTTMRYVHHTPAVEDAAVLSAALKASNFSAHGAREPA
jgi:integrase